MSFYSTRGGACVTASQAVLWGLAHDGGLYVPSMFPQIPTEGVSVFLRGTYQQRAVHVLRAEDYASGEIQGGEQRLRGPGL